MDSTIPPTPPSPRRGRRDRLKAFGLAHEKEIWVAFLIFGLFSIYVLINWATLGRRAADLATPIDRAVPFRAGWEYVYVFVFLFILLPLFVIRDIHYFRRVAAAYVFLLFASYSVYLAFPVRMARPRILGDSFVGWAVRINYLLDKPQNCFPSLHLGSAFLTSFALFKLDFLTGAISTVIAMLIGFSTLYVKQHYLLDVVGGAASAAISYFVFVHRYRVPPEHRGWSIRPFLNVASIYGAVVSWAYAAYRTHLF